MKCLFGIPLAVLFILPTHVDTHGFLIGPETCDTEQLLGKIRNYKSISYNIDSLRNPATSQCRSAPAESPITMTLESGSTLCLALAISNGANHIGPCSVEYHSQSGTVFQIGSLSQCLSPERKGTCDVPNLVTGDMCKYHITFPITESIPSGPGFLRWMWTAQHIGPPYEQYENCIDVTVDSDTPPPKAAPLPKTTQSTLTNTLTPTKTRSHVRSHTRKQPRSTTKYDATDVYCDETVVTRPSPTIARSIDSKDSCTLGEMKCDGNQFGTCVHSNWVWRMCAPGTTCTQQGTSIVCGW